MAIEAKFYEPASEPLTCGEKMYEMVAALYPICRSITGDGLRATLGKIGDYIPLHISEVATGTEVFDWEIPKEWNIRDAFVKNPRGEKIIDFKKSNLHVLNYSVPIHEKMSLEALTPHLFTLKDHPDWIPYRTSYYKETWGFCLSHNDYSRLEEGEYEVMIDSTLENGHLTYGEYYLPGMLPEEILFSCHVCHPSLCNDNLSGIALTTFLAKAVSSQENRKYSYRFLFIPGTIGSICWLSRNENIVQNIRHGLVVVCVGDGGHFSYKKSRKGNEEIDRAALHILQHMAPGFECTEFSPYGYDERQYCSPGFNLSVGSLSRSSHGKYPQYHTSADNLDLVKPKYLEQSLEIYQALVSVLENNAVYVNQQPKCEPRLGKRGLYRSVGATSSQTEHDMALLWVLNLSDGANSLLDIAERSGMHFKTIASAAQALKGCGLIVESTIDF